ncbi:carboxymuconolactone decarboxylase family protein, partial [Hydrogenophaga sp.]|uniref:carboxymuconolactone decarboxylase family protein n=1 Tax=Hydrogenophaga sp. TaxID=1904254 RepID=UPI003568A79D
AHTATSAMRHGVAQEKLAAIANYATSPLFAEAERAALDFALAAASVPNGVTDDMFARLSAHWTEGQIVEILGVIGLFGFFNRWNDSLATTLEAEPMDIANTTLGSSDWHLGKHGKD